MLGLIPFGKEFVIAQSTSPCYYAAMGKTSNTTKHTYANPPEINPHPKLKNKPLQHNFPPDRQRGPTLPWTQKQNHHVRLITGTARIPAPHHRSQHPETVGPGSDALCDAPRKVDDRRTRVLGRYTGEGTRTCTELAPALFIQRVCMLVGVDNWWPPNPVGVFAGRLAGRPEEASRFKRCVSVVRRLYGFLFLASWSSCVTF